MVLWDYEFLADEGKHGTTGEKAQYDPDLVFSSPYDKKHSQYELNTEKTVVPEISYDGSTVFNVYYQCKAYNLSITFPKEDGTTAELHYDNVKFSASLAQFWKNVFAITPENVLFDETHYFGYPNEAVKGDTLVISSTELMAMPEDDVELARIEHKPMNRYLQMYMETLHGKAPDGREVVHNTPRRGQGDTHTYYLQKDWSMESGWAAWLRISKGYIEGFTPAMEYSDGHYYYLANGNTVVYFAYPVDQFEKDYPGVDYHVVYNADGTQHIYEGKDDPIRIYYRRNSYTLNFNTEGGPEVPSQSVLYQDDLSQYNPSSYVVGQTTKTVGNETYVFEGWYTDSKLSKSFSFEGSTMPAYEFDLFARWVPKTFTVSFDTGKGSSIDPIRDVEYGHNVSQPADPTYPGHIFLGWTLNGKPYNFADGVTDNITLKAEWRSIDAWQVSYDLNGGSGSVPSDSTWYYENAGIPVASADGITAPAGKVFIGWKSSGDGKIYYPNSTAPMIPNTAADTVTTSAMAENASRTGAGMTLTAQWGDIPSTTQLTYDFNFAHFGVTTSGSVDSSASISQLANNSKLTLADIGTLLDLSKVSSDWTFTGWYLDPACTKGPYTEVLVDTDKSSANRVYAGWKKNGSSSSSSSASKSSTAATGSTYFPQTSTSPRIVPKTGVDQAEESAWNRSVAVWWGGIVVLVVCVVLITKNKFKMD